MDSEIGLHSPRTVGERTFRVEKLLWFLREKGHTECGPAEVRAFLTYLVTAHREPGGRWGSAGNPQVHQAKKPVKPSTVKTWYGDLRTLFRYLVSQDVIAVSPLAKIPTPISREDQVQPFGDDQVKRLLAAARQTMSAKRDEAILLFLLDTGARASEVCGLRHHDLSYAERRCSVEGKGGKKRTLYFGTRTARALWAYFQNKSGGRDIDPHEGVFLSARGCVPGEPLTRAGLLRLVHRLGEAAGIDGIRCSPHTFRHYFAVRFLSDGGNIFTLQQLLGHQNLKMTQRYLALAEGDIEAQHRSHSPADRLLDKRRR